MPRPSLGFTLIELMVALTLGLLITAAGLSLLLPTLSISHDLLQYTRLNQDLRQLMNTMQRDVARAGHWAAASTLAQVCATHDLHVSARSGSVTVRAYLRGSGTAGTAFAPPLSAAVLMGRKLVLVAPAANGGAMRYELGITGYSNASTLAATVSGPALPATVFPAGSWTVLNPFGAITVAGSCLLFSYDENADGVRGDKERFGYRFDSADQAIESANNADNCNAGTWQNVSDERTFRVSALRFVPSLVISPAGTPLRWTTREYGIAIAAQLAADATADRSLQGNVQVRNLAVE